MKIRPVFLFGLLLSLVLFLFVWWMAPSAQQESPFRESPLLEIPVLRGETIATQPASDDFEATILLVQEMLSGKAKKPGGAFLFYSQAFAGYALASFSKEHPEVVNPLLSALIDAFVSERSVSLFGTGAITIEGEKISTSAAYRSHLALLLVLAKEAGALSSSQEEWHHKLFDELSSAHQSSALLPSYANRVWPADNEIAAAALFLYSNQNPESEDAKRGYESVSRALAALEVDGLPPSEVKPISFEAKDVPRGCALSWTVAFRSYRDAESAKRLYRVYREQFFVSLGPVTGFREWPRGVERAADADSGPIIAGIGAAASAIGIGAASRAGESKDVASLLRVARAAGLQNMENTRNDKWLERAIALWGRNVR
jgi:hypothetical protein